MTLSTSVVAVCCSRVSVSRFRTSASSSSSRSNCPFKSITDEPPSRGAADPIRPFGFKALPRRALLALPLVVTRRLIPAPSPGSGADILSAQMGPLVGAEARFARNMKCWPMSVVGIADIRPRIAMSASLIGRLGSSSFRLSATAVSRCHSRARASLRNRHQGPSTMGFEDEAEQSIPRPYRQSDGRSKQTCELTSSIVPRGTSFNCRVELEFLPIGFDPVQSSCGLPWLVP